MPNNNGLWRNQQISMINFFDSYNTKKKKRKFTKRKKDAKCKRPLMITVMWPLSNESTASVFIQLYQFIFTICVEKAHFFPSLSLFLSLPSPFLSHRFFLRYSRDVFAFFLSHSVTTFFYMHSNCIFKYVM